MAKLILIQIRTKNFPKTAVFSHMTAKSLVPDYMASNRETATCTVTAVRPPKSQKRNSTFFWAPTRFSNVLRSAMDPVLKKINQIQAFPHCFSKMHFNTTSFQTYKSTTLRLHHYLTHPMQKPCGITTSDKNIFNSL